MPQIDVLLRTKRRSISISITPQGRLVVRAPIKFSYENIVKLVNQKQGWIELHQERIKNNLILNKELFNITQVMLLGITYRVVETDLIKKINFANQVCYVPSSFIKRKTLQTQLIKTLKETCENVLKDRVEYFANLMQLTPLSIKFNNSKKNWGSCDLKNNLSFNFRLIMLPHNIIDYIIVHELSHILEFNHSKNFWNIVQSVLPDALDRRKYLKKGDYLLQLFR